jgi:hypothetical protein
MKAPKPAFGALWVHEIKHDGFQVIARKDGARVKLYSRHLTDRFLPIVEALARLRSRSCIIDGGAVAGDERGIHGRHPRQHPALSVRWWCRWQRAGSRPERMRRSTRRERGPITLWAERREGIA